MLSAVRGHLVLTRCLKETHGDWLAIHSQRVKETLLPLMEHFSVLPVMTQIDSPHTDYEE